MPPRSLGSSSSAGAVRKLPSLDTKKPHTAAGPTRGISSTSKLQPLRGKTADRHDITVKESHLPSLKSRNIATIPQARKKTQDEENFVFVRDAKGARGGLLERRWKDDGPKILEPDRTGRPATLLECFQLADDNLKPDLDDLKYLVSHGAEVNICDSTFGWSPLLFAAQTGNFDMVAILLDAKADLGVACNFGNTALHIAARAGDLPLVQYLIVRKVNLETQNHAGWTAITSAASGGHTEVTRTLIAAKAHVVVPDELGRHACMWAARHGHVEVTKLLLETGFDPWLRDYSDLTVADHAAEHKGLHEALLRYEEFNERLLEAARDGDVETCAAALKDGAKANVADRDGISALEMAIEYPSLEIVKLLFKYNAQFSQSNARFQSIQTELKSLAKRQADIATAIIQMIGSCDLVVDASEKANWAGVTTAMKNGAYVETRDDLNRTPLMWAAIHGEVDQCQTLVADHKAGIDNIDETGWTALHFAARCKHVVVVKKLLELKANHSAMNFFGRRPVHEAAIADDDGPVFDAFLKVCGDSMLNAADRDGHAVLQICAVEGSRAALAYLLTIGADPARRDRHGRQVLSLATFHGHLPLVQLLLKHFRAVEESIQANPNSDAGLTLVDAVRDIDEEGCTALIIAARGGHSNVVHALLAVRPWVEVGACDIRKNTALIWAAKRNDRASVELLLNADADVFATNLDGHQAINVTKDEKIRIMLQTDMQKQVIMGKMGPEGRRRSTDIVAVDEGPKERKIACRLRVENMLDTMTAKELEDRIRKLFRSKGSVVTLLDVVVEPITLRPRGIAYVDLGVNVSEADAKAVQERKAENDEDAENLDAEDAYDIMMTRVKPKEAQDLLGPKVRFAKETIVK